MGDLQGDGLFGGERGVWPTSLPSTTSAASCIPQMYEPLRARGTRGAGIGVVRPCRRWLSCRPIPTWTSCRPAAPHWRAAYRGHRPRHRPARGGPDLQRSPGRGAGRRAPGPRTGRLSAGARSSRVMMLLAGALERHPGDTGSSCKGSRRPMAPRLQWPRRPLAALHEGAAATARESAHAHSVPRRHPRAVRFDHHARRRRRAHPRVREETALPTAPSPAQLRQHLAAARDHGGVLSVHAPLPGVRHRARQRRGPGVAARDGAPAAAAVPVMPCETTAGPAEGARRGYAPSMWLSGGSRGAASLSGPRPGNPPRPWSAVLGRRLSQIPHQ